VDPLTQAALGAALAQSAAKPQEARLAATVGAVAGLLADADVLIRSSSDPLLTLDYHRHFSHSLIFVPAGALIAAVLLWPFLRRHLAFSRLYLFSFLGFALSGALDACTSYGTHLLWPFSDEPVAWNLISVVDPVFTLGLLAAVVCGAVRHRPKTALIGLGFAAVYLLAGWIQQQRALGVVEELARARGQTTDQLLVKPTLGNLLLWRSIYLHGENFHIDAIRVGRGPSRIYEGGSLKRALPHRNPFELPPDSTTLRDAERFHRFSDGFTARHPELKNVLGDARYSMTPNGLIPLWGIEIDPQRPEAHVKYRVFRDTGQDQRRRFWSMLLGAGPVGADGAGTAPFGAQQQNRETGTSRSHTISR
jgi:inner membrane protein